MEDFLTRRLNATQGGVQTCQDTLSVQRGYFANIDQRIVTLDRTLQDHVNIQAAATATSTQLHDHAATLLQNSRQVETELFRQDEALLHRINVLENRTEEHAREQDVQVLRNTQLDIAARVQLLETRLLRHDLRVRHELLANKITHFVAEQSRLRDAEALWRCLRNVAAGDTAGLDGALAGKTEAVRSEGAVGRWVKRLLVPSEPGKVDVAEYKRVGVTLANMKEGSWPRGFEEWLLDAWGHGVLETCGGWVDEYLSAAGMCQAAAATSAEGGDAAVEKDDEARGVVDMVAYEAEGSVVNGEETASEYSPDTDMVE